MTSTNFASSRTAALVVTVGLAIAVALLYHVIVVPWADSWGASSEDLAVQLPGDELLPEPHRRVHHVVTIDAPPEAVWPWLVQVGQDRAGFNSYDWLENIFLAGIRNRNVIRPEWQTRRVGDFVPAVKPGYLGFDVEGKAGWKVNLVEPNRALGLEKWGTFALVPTAVGGTRLVARQHLGNSEPAAVRPLLTYFLDPAQFVMERRMLLTIKDLAEGSYGEPGWAAFFVAAGWWLGAAALAFFFVERGRWIPLLAAVAVAAVVWQQTGHLEGALAAYIGLGLAAAGLVAFRWWSGIWIIGLGTFTFAVLALARDAWIVFGLTFAIAAAWSVRSLNGRSVMLRRAVARA